jgi:hypothetical protein
MSQATPLPDRQAIGRGWIFVLQSPTRMVENTVLITVLCVETNSQLDSVTRLTSLLTFDFSPNGLDLRSGNNRGELAVILAQNPLMATISYEPCPRQ